jgi:hypothetical protein
MGIAVPFESAGCVVKSQPRERSGDSFFVAYTG